MSSPLLSSVLLSSYFILHPPTLQHTYACIFLLLFLPHISFSLLPPLFLFRLPFINVFRCYQEFSNQFLLQLYHCKLFHFSSLSFTANLFFSFFLSPSSPTLFAFNFCNSLHHHKNFTNNTTNHHHLDSLIKMSVKMLSLHRRPSISAISSRSG